MNSSVRILFMGSPDFAVPALQALARDYAVIGVVTQPDRPAGRGGSLQAPAVKIAAQQLGLPLIQPEKIRLPEVMLQLKNWMPDLIIVAAFGQILRADVLDLPRFGCLNIHGSLLPRWRGAAPIQAALLAGDAVTGATIMKMDAGVDTGPILARQVIPIAADDTAGSLFDKIAALGTSLLLQTLPAYLSGELMPQPQAEEGVTRAPMLKKEDGRLDFTCQANELERRVRAMHPWPGAFFDWQGQPLKVLKAHVDFVFTYMLQPAGRHVVHQNLPAVYAADNQMLVLDEVQPAGKKPMSGQAFLAGAREWLTSQETECRNMLLP